MGVCVSLARLGRAPRNHRRPSHGRGRRKKCDERRPVCAGCAALGIVSPAVAPAPRLLLIPQIGPGWAPARGAVVVGGRRRGDRDPDRLGRVSIVLVSYREGVGGRQVDVAGRGPRRRRGGGRVNRARRAPVVGWQVGRQARRRGGRSGVRRQGRRGRLSEPGPRPATMPCCQLGWLAGWLTWLNGRAVVGAFAPSFGCVGHGRHDVLADHHVDDDDVGLVDDVDSSEYCIWTMLPMSINLPSWKTK